MSISLKQRRCGAHLYLYVFVIYTAIYLLVGLCVYYAYTYQFHLRDSLIFKRFEINREQF